MELLISEVQKRSVLWNKWDKKYRDRIVCDREWDAIAKKTKMNKEDVKKKWRNLRDTFFRERKKVTKSRSGDPQESAEIYTGKWSYFKSLLFLKDTTTPRCTDGNISDCDDIDDVDDTLGKTPENYDGDDDNSISEHIENDDYSNVSIPSTSNIETLTPSTSTNKRSGDSAYSQTRMKKKPKSQEDKYLEDLLKIESKKVAILEEAKNVPIPESDEDMLFFQSLNPYFKKLSSIQKLRVRNQFQNILINELSSQEQPLSTSTYIPEPIPVPQMSSSVYSAQQYTSQDIQSYQYP